MENASKALLIAGAILIVILLIAMGMKVFTSSSGSVDQVDGVMQTTEMTTFNNKFLAYAGVQNGSQVKSLANIVISHNVNNPRKVSFQGETTGTAILSKIANVDSFTRYTITMEDSNTDGYIDTITF